jgi:hypothetical protein
MNRQMLVVLVLVAMAASAVMAVPARAPRSARIEGPVMLTGTEDVVSNGVVADEHPILTPLDDVIDTAGWTYYDLQENGTQGKQIGVDAAGYVHVLWTCGVNVGSGQRHIYYNVWDPTAQDFMLGGGVQVDAATRAGFCNLVVDPAGWGYPVFHQVTVTDAHTAAAIDFIPRQGAFTTSQVPLFGNLIVIWPHAAIDVDGNLQTVSTPNPAPYNTYYAKGHPTFDPNPPDSFGSNIEWPNGFVQMEPQSFITCDIAASWHTQKVAIAYLDNHGGSAEIWNDVYLKISDDGGDTWGAPVNVTNFHIVDPNCCANIGDPNICNGDTLQPWLDLSVLIDNDDVVHIAFSTMAFYYFDATCVVNANPALVYSMIWHWDSHHREYNKIGEAWYIPADPNFPGAGANNIMIQRPSLAQDTTTGNLFCSFQKFDSLVVGADPCFRPVGDAYVSVSTDGGRFWAVPTNVTNTAPVQGNDRSERDINIAPVAYGGFVHMEYMVDHVAGTFVTTTPECTESHNEMIYQRIPVDEIATSPLTPAYPLRSDSTGYPYQVGAGPVRGSLPQEFALYQNYPNPFNPNTNIQFDLTVAGNVSLKVFDITGREAAVLLNNERLEAGAHVVEFNATDMPSGVYFYRLEAVGHQLTRKMMLVK